MRRYGYKIVDGIRQVDFPPGVTMEAPGIVAVDHTSEGVVVYEKGDDLPERFQNAPYVNTGDDTDGLVLWRYVDLPKLYVLLLQGRLVFTPALVMRKFEPYEFRIPPAERVHRRTNMLRVMEEERPGDPFNERLVDHILERDPHGAEDFAISCWHENVHENNALWRGFVPNGGVAVKTTLGRLKHSLRNAGRHYMTASRVEYIDYETEFMKPHPTMPGYEPVFHKARFFEYEREFRLALHTFNAENEPLDEFCRVPVKVEDLIEEIVVGPAAQFGFPDVVTDMVGRAKLDPKIVRRSRIDTWAHG